MATEGRGSVNPTFTPWQLGFGKLLALAGFMVVMVAAVVGFVVASQVAGYYADPKSVRDVAAAGSEMLSDQGTIAAVGAWLAPLKFVGLATILTGIGIANIRKRATS